jgi:uncharacterized protein YodC (DUF2158 family)
MAQIFNVGDVVELKSGGPKMTVATVNDPPGKVWCQWFDGKKKDSGTFAMETLKPVSS